MKKFFTNVAEVSKEIGKCVCKIAAMLIGELAHVAWQLYLIPLKMKRTWEKNEDGKRVMQ